MNLEASNTSLQPKPEQMDKEFTTTAYLNVQENLKLPTEGEVRLEEPARSAGTLSSLQNLDKELSFTNQFLSEKDRFRDLSEADMKEILHHRMWESNSYQAHEDHKMLYEALEKSMARDHTDHLLTDLAEAQRKKKKRRDSPKTPPGSPPHQPLFLHHQQVHLELQELLKLLDRLICLLLLHLHTPTRSSGDEDIGHDHIPTVNLRQNWWKPLTKDRPATPELAWSIPSSDLHVSVNNWASALASTYAPPPKNSLLAQTGDMAIFIDWFCKKQGITELKQQDLEGPVYEICKVFHPNVIHLQYQMEECHKLLTDQVDESIISWSMYDMVARVAGWKQITDKRTKNKAKIDKTEHVMEKREKDKEKVKVKVQSQQKSKSKSTPQSQRSMPKP
ncbi:hypothetical protein Tco_0588762 [Tanacetum coccineum]